MGKQKGVKQRTKGNRMPSSSAKTVDLIAKNSNTKGFTGFEALSGDLGYVPIFNDKETFENTDIDAEFRIVLRKLSKRDQTTKLKAIAEFRELCDKKSEDCAAILPYWPRIYNRLCQDDDKKVREGCHKAMESLVGAVGKKIAPYLKEVIASWFLGLCDSYAPSALSCDHCLNVTFPGDKKMKAFLMYRKEIFQRIQAGINNVQQNKTSSDVDEQFRGLSESLSAFSLFITMVVKNERIENEIEYIFEQPRFWKFMKFKSPSVRKAFYDVLSTLSETSNELLEKHLNVIVKSVMHRLNEENILVCKAIYACAVSIVTNTNNWAEHADINKGMLPQIFVCLKNGCYGLVSAVCPAILKLFHALPEGVRNITIYTKFFDSMKLCMEERKVKYSKGDLQVAYHCYFEMIKLAISQIVVKPAVTEDNKKYVTEMLNFLKIDILLPTLKQSLCALTSKLISNLIQFNLSECLRLWGKQESDEQLELCDFLWGHISDLIIENYNSWENSVLENNISDKRNEEILFFLNMLINPDHFNVQSHRHVSFEPSKLPQTDTKEKDTGNAYFHKNLTTVLTKLLEVAKFDKHKRLLHFYVTSIKTVFSYPQFLSTVNIETPQYFNEIAVPNTISYFKTNTMLSNCEINDLVSYCKDVIKCCIVDSSDIQNGLANLIKDKSTMKICLRLFIYVLENKLNEDFVENCILDEGVKSLPKTLINYGIENIGSYDSIQENDVWKILKTCINCKSLNHDTFMINKDEATNYLLRIQTLIKEREINSPNESLNFTTLMVDIFNRKELDIKTQLGEFLYFMCKSSKTPSSHVYNRALKVGLTCLAEANLCDIEFFKCLSIHIKSRIQDVNLDITALCESMCIFFGATSNKLPSLEFCNCILVFINTLFLSVTEMNKFFDHFSWQNWASKLHVIKSLQPYDLSNEGNISRVDEKFNNLSKILEDLLLYLHGIMSSECFNMFQEKLQKDTCLQNVVQLLNVVNYMNPNGDSDENICRKFNTAFHKQWFGILFNEAFKQGGVWCYCLELYTEKPYSQWIDDKSKDFEIIVQEKQFSAPMIQLFCYLAHKNLMKQSNSLMQSLFEFIELEFGSISTLFLNVFSLFTILAKQKYTEEEDDRFAFLLEKILEFRQTQENSILFNCDITHEDGSVILLNSEFAKFICVCITCNSSLLTPSMWDFAQCSLLAWSESVSISCTNITEWKLVHYRFTYNVFHLLSTLHEFANSDKANNDPLLPHNLTTEWKEFFYPNAVRDLLPVFSNLMNEQDEKISEILFGVVAKCFSLAPVNSLVTASDNLVPKLTVGSDLPDNMQTVLNHLCALLFNNTFNSTLFMNVMYTLLQKVLIYACSESGGNLPFPTLLKTLNKLYGVLEDYPKTHVPTTKPKRDEIQEEESYSSDDDISDSETCSQHEVWLEKNKLTILRILLCWRLLVNTTQELTTEKKILYLDALRKEHRNIDNFLFPFLSQILPNKSFREEFGSNDDLLLACGHLSWLTYKDLMFSLPVLSRAWYSELSNVEKLEIDNYTSTYITPFLCKDEIEKVLLTRDNFEETDSTMKIQARSATREVVAKYSLNEMDMEIVIKFAPNHPLCPVKVLTEKRASIVASQWRYWILQITTFLQFQNGSIVDGLKLWKKRVDKQFDGLEECMICFSMVHGTNQSLPKLQCKTCKKKYHAECLYKWFDTSNQSTCPLCRSTMIFR